MIRLRLTDDLCTADNVFRRTAMASCRAVGQDLPLQAAWFLGTGLHFAGTLNRVGGNGSRAVLDTLADYAKEPLDSCAPKKK